MIVSEIATKERENRAARSGQGEVRVEMVAVVKAEGANVPIRVQTTVVIALATDAQATLADTARTWPGRGSAAALRQKPTDTRPKLRKRY
jgi:hypothetical protein